MRMSFDEFIQTAIWLIHNVYPRLSIDNKAAKEFELLEDKAAFVIRTLDAKPAISLVAMKVSTIFYMIQLPVKKKVKHIIEWCYNELIAMHPNLSTVFFEPPIQW